MLTSRSAAAAAPARIRKSVCIAALGGLLVATPATAHTIDVRQAAAAVLAQAQTLGQVDQARCWRPMMAIHVRARHRALCAAWWIHTPTASCTGFYEVRMARHPSRRLLVIQTFQPWCATARAPTSAEGRAR
jgi:hypothetical protein